MTRYSSTPLYKNETVEPNRIKQLVRLECGHDVVMTALQLELFFALDCERCGAINQLCEVIGIVQDDEGQ